jgi:hypothetical protein
MMKLVGNDGMKLMRMRMRMMMNKKTVDDEDKEG